MLYVRMMGLVRSLVLLALINTVACSANGTHPQDPYEQYNRRIFVFNDKLDKTILKPAAKSYQRYIPVPMDRSIGNFFANLGDLPGAVNGLLQAKPKAFAKDSSRFVINTTVGLLGLFDVASHWNIASANEDFGQTLAHWGVKSGPYIMWPFLGGRTARDTAGLGVDSFFSPLQYVDSVSIEERIALRSISVIDFRASVLEAEQLLQGDRYSLLREAYFQRQEQKLNDGVIKDNFGDDSFGDGLFDK